MNVNGKTEVLGIIGDPVEHTLSPDIHNYISGAVGEDYIYIPFHVTDDIDAAVKGAYRLGIKGLNVTVPYKEAVIKSLCDLDSSAKMIGAVNTLVRTPEGYKGYNTDIYGLSIALREEGVSLKGKDVLILGAGGAARSAAFMAYNEAAGRVFIINRNKDKAEDIRQSILSESESKSADVNVTALGIDEYSLLTDLKGHIIIQCTSLGLRSKDTLLINDDAIYKDAAFGYDLIYNPSDTPFLNKLRAFGIPHSGGLSMLIYQGIIAHNLWNGYDIEDASEKALDQDVSALKAVLMRRLFGENIILTGFMGSGKTTVGRVISKKYGKTFIDTDAEIEKREGMSIPEIFESRGEKYFRDAESRVLKDISESAANSVISTGGGAILKEDNRMSLRRCGKVYFLDASVSELTRRVGNASGRPALDTGGEESIEAKIKKLKAERDLFYGLAADIVINTDGLSPDKVADVIMSGNLP